MFIIQHTILEERRIWLDWLHEIDGGTPVARTETTGMQNE